MTVYASGFNMTGNHHCHRVVSTTILVINHLSDYIKIEPYSLPLLNHRSMSLQVNLTEVYDRSLKRRDRSTSPIEVID
jgi:hypothetical protein